MEHQRNFEKLKKGILRDGSLNKLEASNDSSQESDDDEHEEELPKLTKFSIYKYSMKLTQTC